MYIVLPRKVSELAIKTTRLHLAALRRKDYHNNSPCYRKLIFVSATYPNNLPRDVFRREFLNRPKNLLLPKTSRGPFWVIVLDQKFSCVASRIIRKLFCIFDRWIFGPEKFSVLRERRPRFTSGAKSIMQILKLTIEAVQMNLVTITW